MGRKEREADWEVIKFDYCGVRRRKLQDLSRGHIINSPVFFAKEFRIYPKYHDFQQKSNLAHKHKEKLKFRVKITGC